MNTNSYDKPFIDYPDMLELLKSRNIIIDNQDFAISALQNFSYYGLLNGYKNTFIQDSTTDNFVEGTHFNEIYTLHLLDTNLSNMLFKYILYLERALKSRISYVVSKNYGVYTDISNHVASTPDDYLYKKHYSNSTNKRSDILWKLKHSVSDTSKHNPIIAHYVNNKNHVPPWILTTNIPYGLTIEWYRILKTDDKTNICETFISPGILSEDDSKQFLVQALGLTKEYRNRIAHGNRVFNIPNLPALPKDAVLTLSFGTLTETEYDSHLGMADLFALFLIIIILFNDQYLISNFLSDCKNVLKPYENTKFTDKSIYEVFGLPHDLFDRLEKLTKIRFTNMR